MKWEKKRIRDFATVYDGPHATPMESETGPVFLGIKNIRPEGGLNLSEIRHINESEYEKWTKRVTPKGMDIVLSYEATLHRYAIIPNDFVGCLGRRMALVRVNQDQVSERFLYYTFLSDSWRGFIDANKLTGATVDRISITDFPDYQVPIPPLPTQRRIASILSAYDDLIENNLKRIKLLEEKASLMYKLMQKELSDVEKINLYEFADIQMGFAFKAEAFNEEGEGIPIIRIRDIPSQMTKSYTTQEVENQYWVEKGDLLIGMDGEFHMNEWLGQRGYLVQRVCRLRAKNELYQSYLWQALKEPIHYYETTISGATVAHLGKKHLEEIFIAQPKDSMLNELEEMNTMRKLKIVLAEQNTKLREARDILLPKLMNGQIEV